MGKRLYHRTWDVFSVQGDDPVRLFFKEPRVLFFLKSVFSVVLTLILKTRKYCDASQGYVASVGEADCNVWMLCRLVDEASRRLSTRYSCITGLLVALNL